MTEDEIQRFVNATREALDASTLGDGLYFEVIPDVTEAQKRAAETEGQNLIIGVFPDPFAEQITVPSCEPVYIGPVVVTVPADAMEVAQNIIAQLQPHLRTNSGTLILPDTSMPMYFDGTTREPDAVYTNEWTGVPQASDSDLDEVLEDEEPAGEEAFVTGETEPNLGNTGLPHPGISDEFWEKVPLDQREPFSAFLVRQESISKIAEGMDVPVEVILPEEGRGLYGASGWCAPGESLWPSVPDVTARRGGIQFSGGPDMHGLMKPLTKLSKKELRAEVERLRKANAETRTTLQKALRKERKRVRRLRRTLTKVLGL